MRAPAKPKPGEPIQLVTLTGGGYRYRTTLDVAPVGAPRKQQVRTHRSLKAARAHVAQVRADITRGRYPTHGVRRLTFRALCEQYLERVRRGDHGRAAPRASTLRSYEMGLARAVTLLGDRPIDSLGYPDVAGMVDTLAARYAHQSVANTLVLVRAAFAYAVREDMLAKNPAEDISPKGKPATPRQGYTPEQVQALSRAADGDRLAGLWAVLLLGLRRSEALGLVWDDVDLAGGLLHVRRSRTWLRGGPVDSPPKTERGERTVHLDPVTVGRLKAMRAGHAAERLALGLPLTGADVLAATAAGGPLDPDQMTEGWRALCARAEVPYLGMHAARHAQVKMLRAAGLPDGVIAARLGHSEQVMRDTYGVPHQSEQAAAAAVMARLLA